MCSIPASLFIFDPGCLKSHECSLILSNRKARATVPPPPSSSLTKRTSQERYVRYYLLLQEAREQVLGLLEGLGVAAGGLGAEGDGADGGALEVLGGDEVGVFGAGQLVEHGADEAAGVLGVAAHAGHDHGHVDVALALAPAVVVGRHADDLEGHLGLARELGLGQQRHADDGAAPGAVHVGLGAGRELRALCEDWFCVSQRAKKKKKGEGGGRQAGRQAGRLADKQSSFFRGFIFDFVISLPRSSPPPPFPPFFLYIRLYRCLHISVHVHIHI